MTNMVDNTIDVNTENNEIEDFRDRYIRVLADYQNLQKRTARDLSNIAKTTTHQVFKQFIPLYNDIKAGLKYNDPGIKIIYNKFVSILMSNQIGIIDKNFFDTKCEGKFNDNYAEALSVSITPDPDLDNCVEDVIEDGFFDIKNNSVISQAKVTVLKE